MHHFQKHLSLLFYLAFSIFQCCHLNAANGFFGNLHCDRLNLLKHHGFNPQIVYDIGAYKGEWSVNTHRVFPNSQFYLFEANPAHMPALNNTLFPYFISLLGDKEDLVTFYSNNSTGDSFFIENSSYYSESSTQNKKLAMTTLASIVVKNKLPLPDLIKMDVQGAERLIIDGSPEIIKNAEVIVLEASILEYNHGAPLIYEMMSLMDSTGYLVLDVLEHHYYPTGELIQIDLLFVKKNSKLIKKCE